MEKSNVAWSLETTGFSAQNCQITASGFYRPRTEKSPEEVTLYLNADGQADEIDTSFLTRALSDQTGYDTLSVSVFDSDHGILEAMERYTKAMDYRRERLVTYNGEKWTGGFALPFTRTRCLQQGTGWIFDNVPHFDLSESIQKRFNTQVMGLDTMSSEELQSFAEFLGLTSGTIHSDPDTDTLRTRINEEGFSEHDLEAWAANDDAREVPSMSLETLVGSHGALLDYEEADEFDPFDDGGEAVIAFNEQEFEAIARHTVADITRISNLTSVVEEYVGDRYIEEIRL